MKYLEIALYVILVITLIIIFVFLKKTEKPLKNALFGVLISYVSLAIINNTTFLTGIYIPINPYTVVTSAVFGIPGISGLIIFCTIFGL